MADFNVNSSKNIPSNARGSSSGDSANDNGKVPSPFNPLLPVLQGIGALNLLGNLATENFHMADTTPSKTPTLEAKKSSRSLDEQMAQANAAEAAQEAVNWDAFDSLYFDRNGMVQFNQPLTEWYRESIAKSDSTPEQRGQFAAQNIAANVLGGGLPSVPAVEPPAYNANFGSTGKQPDGLQGLFVNFAKE
jgi:hypothetical protein